MDALPVTDFIEALFSGEVFKATMILSDSLQAG